MEISVVAGDLPGGLDGSTEQTGNIRPPKPIPLFRFLIFLKEVAYVGAFEVAP
jgi:hypothetical protein